VKSDRSSAVGIWPFRLFGVPKSGQEELAALRRRIFSAFLMRFHIKGFASRVSFIYYSDTGFGGKTYDAAALFMLGAHEPGRKRVV
jgi:hypothetical protein